MVALCLYLSGTSDHIPNYRGIDISRIPVHALHTFMIALRFCLYLWPQLGYMCILCSAQNWWEFYHIASFLVRASSCTTYVHKHRAWIQASPFSPISYWTKYSYYRTLCHFGRYGYLLWQCCCHANTHWHHTQISQVNIWRWHQLM